MEFGACIRFEAAGERDCGGGELDDGVTAGYHPDPARSVPGPTGYNLSLGIPSHIGE